MSKQSKDQYDDKGNLINGYNYELRVWVLNGIIQNCGHPETMRPGCCNADKFQGKRLVEVKF